MNMLVTFSALVFLAQLISASPVADTNVAKAIDTLKFASMATPSRQDRERRSTFEKTDGLICYNHEGSSPTIELPCDWLGGAKYCTKGTVGGNKIQSCAIEPLIDAYKKFGLEYEGCVTVGDIEFCLCTGNLCNV